MVQDNNKMDDKENVRKESNSTTKKTPEKLKKDRKVDHQTKVVIRHLPPSMTEEEFTQQISPIPEHNHFCFVKADLNLGQFAFCRAYINFIHQEDIFIFKDKFDGYVFVDSKGNEYPASVEFTPYQKVPRKRIGPNGQPISAKKRDNKCGTIEQDPEYVKFLESLEAAKHESNLPSAEIYLEEIEAKEKELRSNHGVPKMTTPLIEFIKQRKAEKHRQREERREERRRQQLEQKKLKEAEMRKQKEKVILQKQREKEKMDQEKEKSKSEKVADFEKTAKKKTDSTMSGDVKEKTTFTVKVLQKVEKEKNQEGKHASDMKKSGASNKVSKEENYEGPDKDDSPARKDEKQETRRIRNKDRPSIEIYRPLAKRGSAQESGPSRESNREQDSTSKSENSKGDSKSDRNVRKTKVYFRSK